MNWRFPGNLPVKEQYLWVTRSKSHGEGHSRHSETQLWNTQYHAEGMVLCNVPSGKEKYWLSRASPASPESGKGPVSRNHRNTVNLNTAAKQQLRGHRNLLHGIHQREADQVVGDCLQT